MTIRNRLAAAALLATTAVSAGASPLHAQADTLTPRPLFRIDDAYLAAFFVIGTVALRPVDKTWANHLQDSTTQSNKLLGDAASTVRTIAEPGSYLIGLSMYAVGRLTHHEKAADLGLHGTEAIAVGALMGDVLKDAFGRARPYVNVNDPNNFSFGRGLKGGQYQSFPSGHTVAAFAAAAAVTSETSRWWPNTRWIIGPAMYGGATLVGLSRMYNNKHWASDVMMGAAIGTFAGNKVVRYHHSHPGNKIDKWLLGATIVPEGGHAYAIEWTVSPE